MKISVIFNNEKQTLETDKFEFKASEKTNAIAYSLTYAIAEARALMIANNGRIKNGFNFSRRFEISLKIGTKKISMPMANQIDFSKTFRATERKNKEGEIVMTKQECFEKCANAIYSDIHTILAKSRNEQQVLSIDSVQSTKFLGC
jgi:hypothetical protein